MELRVAAFSELDATTLYSLLRLRVDVFVVEQECAYREIDGRDLEDAALHLWLEDAGQPAAYLRVLTDPDGVARIGRVCTAAEYRGRGLSGRLMTEALARVGERECRLDAQAHLVHFYAGFGFVPNGPEYVEDGIAHVPMRRPS